MASMRAAPALVFALAAAASGCSGVNDSFSYAIPPVPANTGFFTIAPNAPVVRDRVRHTATMLGSNGSHAGEVLIVGGFSATVGGPVASTERYRAVGQTFAQIAGTPIATARGRHSATLLRSNEVLVAGGEGVAGIVGTAELYNPGTDGFGPASSNLVTARRNHSAMLVNDAAGTVLVAGGDTGGPPPMAAIGSIERYTPGVGFQALPGGLVTARTRHSAQRTPAGDVILLGGFDAAGAPLASVEILSRFDGSARAALNPMNIPRAQAAAVPLADGRILIAGGIGVGGAALDSAEVYDPVNERSAGAGTMSRTRANPRSARVFDGRLLVTGDDNTADIWDPQTSTFVQPTSTLAQPRAEHTLTPLGTAEVLIFGGGPSFAPAELFDPR